MTEIASQFIAIFWEKKKTGLMPCLTFCCMSLYNFQNISYTDIYYFFFCTVSVSLESIDQDMATCLV